MITKKTLKNCHKGIIKMEQIKNYIKKLKENKSLIPMLVAIVLAFVMFLTIFMPYASATEEYAERLEQYSDYYALEELDMNGDDFINISMAKYAKVYSKMSEDIFGDSATGVLYVVLVVLIAVFAIGALVFAFFKKPIAVIVFDILAFVVFCIQNWDYKDRGVIPSDNYNWGGAYYIFIICAIAVLVCAVASIILKKIFEKKTVGG